MGPEMRPPAYPRLYQINTRVWLTELSRTLNRPATLDDIPDGSLDRLALMGFDWLWFLSVWRTGPAGQRISRENEELRREFQGTLPDLEEADIEGSGFAITGYEVSPALGGEAALDRLRARLRRRGLRLMLDFVPNHTALDHPWVESHPEYYVRGSELDLLHEPGNYTWAKHAGGDLLLALGRDPYFPGWPDTLQLDYSDPGTHEAMTQELIGVARRCDGVRCDMAMLILPDVFERTWGRRMEPFWPAAIERVRKISPEFTFMAEVYWDLEWTMMQQGFDYAYDKRLYDRLRDGRGQPVHDHLLAGLDYQRHLARFMENHDEPRAAASFPAGEHEAAAIITYLTPGLRFFHQGQFEGSKVRISPHLIRAPKEPVDDELARFYGSLVRLLADHPELRDGDWRLAEVVPAWSGDETWRDFVCWSWEGATGRLLVTVNYSASPGRCFVRMPFGIGEPAIRFTDLMSEAVYDRDTADLRARGLFLDVPAWRYHVFDISDSRPGEG
jgi:hypothetical protein